MLTALLRTDLSLSPRSRAFVPLRLVYIALALIAITSSLLAVAQTLGWHPLYQWNTISPGLFYNPMAQGEIMALSIVLLLVNRLWWFAPALMPGLYLAHSRGAWAALAFGLLATRFRHPLWLLVLVLGLGLVYSVSPSPSDLKRLVIWHAALTHLTFWGNGPGSFWFLWIGNPSSGAWWPQYAHNDYIQTVFELGIWSLIPFTILAWALSRTAARNWPVLVTFAFMACFSMPLHIPMTLTIGAIALATTIAEVPNA